MTSLCRRLYMGEELMTTEEGDTVLNIWQKKRLSSLLFLQKYRVELVDELESYISSILDHTLQQQLLSRDDYEDVAHEGGPRKQVRKLLDIIYCLGEENASIFCQLFQQLKTSRKQTTSESEYTKSIQKHKNVLKRRSDFINFYNCRHGDKFYFSDYFVNLLLVNGHYSLEMKKNELLTFGQQRIHLQNKKEDKCKLTLQQLFDKQNERRAPNKILVSGVAGIGKTVFVQKILVDFSNAVEYQHFDFVLNFTFRDLNLINKPITLREVICKKHGHLSNILDDIFKNSHKLLAILDGFDEFKSYNQLDMEQYVMDPDEKAEIPQLIGSLIQGELLPDATVLLTSRPTVINHIPVECIERFVIITGFSVTEIEDYFQKFFGDKRLGSEHFVAVKDNHFLFTLCYIPAFCWIVCSVLKGISTLHIECPKTMTDIYCHYLIVLLKYHAHEVYSTKDGAVLHGVLGLGQIAYHSLLKHETLFYEKDLEKFQKLPKDIVNSFLDTTCVQDLGYTENVLSFTHFTIQEFFAAFYYAHAENITENIMDMDLQKNLGIGSGYLDLFLRFLSGLLSVRNQEILSKHLNLGESKKSEMYTSWLVNSIVEHCETGRYILNLLHCLFEQQMSSLANRITPSVLRLNVSDNIFSPIDFDVLAYFLDIVPMEIDELDLTATHVDASYLEKLQPYLHRCRKLWLGENNLDIEAITILSGILMSPDCKIELLGLGWTQLEDEEFLELYRCLPHNRSLTGLWLEGNNINYTAIQQFSDISSFNSTLRHVVLLGNNVDPENITALKEKTHKSIIVAHIDENYGKDFWQGWWDWIFQRCKICNDEKIVSFLTKVYRGLGLCDGKDAEWMKDWYMQINGFLQERIQQCSIRNIARKMEDLKQMFQQQSGNL
ncbi:NLR family CARD domain-containing protein 3-like [Hyla sarda]|uniref:NLR family CARD domain-containing protein 3-like n=1 Tax=Hyla sarda TaxID=327740 RepID=UPI0024C3B86E|nr:NLR family CARD domain-containing protein 3-like [Hyla sarda]